MNFDVNVEYMHLQHVFLAEPVSYCAFVAKSVHRLPLQVTSIALLVSAVTPHSPT